ncbi:MAG TPA: OmpA family protein [Geobacteraceae bacterium]|nr:OmpA family protein [Geobacteraceae bacterium]
MSKRIRFVSVIAGLSLSLGGCVSMGKYELKEKEANETSHSLQDLQSKFNDLSKENSGLKSRNEKLDNDVAALAKDKETLKSDNMKLNELLKSKSDALSKEISELRQSSCDLEHANEKLKGDIAGLQKAKVEEVQKTSRTYEDMLEKLKNEISQGQVTISELKGKLTVNMVDAILFDSGKAEVKPAGLEVLKKVIDILKTVKDKVIRIEGHTDNVQISGSLAVKYPSNWELSAVRAVNVTRYLQQQGIDPTLLSAIAYGEYHPVASNDTDEGKVKNRRIEIILVPKDAP